MDHYKTIGNASTAEFKDRGSKFIAYAFPVETPEEFKLRLKQLKKEHPKATHHCFAYRLGLEGNIRVSDDGEPSGTAGKPILGQIDSKELINVAVIVVRYFGGTLLGVPGLINAYKTCTALALQLVPILKKPVEIQYFLHFDYTMMNEVMRIIKHFNCTIVKQEMQLFCDMQVGFPKKRVGEIVEAIKDLNSVEIKSP